MFDDITFDPSGAIVNEYGDLDYGLYDFLSENATIETGFMVEESHQDLHYYEFVIFLDKPTHNNCYFLGLNIGGGYFYWVHLIGSPASLKKFLPPIFHIGRGLINEASLINPKQLNPTMTAQSKYVEHPSRYDC